jgi:serine protease 16
MSTGNLIYLSSEQALADLASFREFIHAKLNLTEANKWISFGISYSAALSAWMRLKYPHLIHAAVSSSAPVLAKVDFGEYNNIVAQSLRKQHSSKCTENIRTAREQLQSLTSKSTDGWSKAGKLFKSVCAHRLAVKASFYCV